MHPSHSASVSPALKKRRVIGQCQSCGESFTNKVVANKHKRTCPALMAEASNNSNNQQFLPDGTPLIHILELARLTQLGLPRLPEPELRTPQTLMAIKAVCDQLAMMTPP